MRRMMIQVALLLLIGVATGFAQGQGNGQLGQLRDELQRTDEIIAQAREAVVASNNLIAAQALERAVKLQEGARKAYNGANYLIALELSKKAREQAAVAVSASRMASQLEGVVSLRLERAETLLERARELWSGPLNQSASMVLDQARLNLSQSWQFYRQGQLRASLKLVEQVEQAAQRLRSIARSRDRAATELERRQEELTQLREQARAMIADCDSEPAQEHLKLADEAYQMALKLQSENSPEAALMTMNRAREAYQRASRLCASSDRLRERYRRLEQEAERLTESLGPNDDQARQLVAQAKSQLQLAYKFMNNNKANSAIVSLQAARLALRQAQKLMTGSN